MIILFHYGNNMIIAFGLRCYRAMMNLLITSRRIR